MVRWNELSAKEMALLDHVFWSSGIFFEAFANIYRGVAADIQSRLTGAGADPIAADYPRVEAGARGVRFIEKTVESARSDRKWIDMG